MAIRLSEQMTWSELGRQARAGAIAMVALGPLEDHGPHLPTAVDLYLAQGFARELGHWLERRTGRDIVMLPSIPLGAQLLYSLGCLRLKANSLRSVLRGLGRELAREGFTACVVVTAHGAGSHLAALEVACRQASRWGIRMLNPSGPLMLKFLSGGLRSPLEKAFGRAFTREEWQALKVDYHAGAWETSMMLRWHPDLVGDYKSLPPHSAWDGLKVNPGYFGSPALSSVRLGEAAIEVLTRLGGEFVEKNLAPRKPSSSWWLWGGLAAGAALALYRRRLRRPAR